MSLPSLLQAERPTGEGFLLQPRSMPAPRFASREADALGRAVRARQAFQERLVAMFNEHINGLGPEPSDSDLRVFALLAAAEQRLEQNLAIARGCPDGDLSEDDALVFRQQHAA